MPAWLAGLVGVLVIVYGGQRVWIGRAGVRRDNLSPWQQRIRGIVFVAFGILLLAKALRVWDPASLLWNMR